MPRYVAAYRSSILVRALAIEFSLRFPTIRDLLRERKLVFVLAPRFATHIACPLFRQTETQVELFDKTLILSCFVLYCALVSFREKT